MKVLYKTTCIFICLFLLFGSAHSIFSSEDDDAANNQPTSVKTFFDRLRNLKDPIQYVKVLGTIERLKQMTFVREELRLQASQQQLVAQEQQELLMNLYRQLFGLSRYYNIKKDLTASKVINSLLQHFIPDELLDQLQNHLPFPDDVIAPRQPNYHERLAGFISFTNIIWFISISLFVISITILFRNWIFPLILDFIYWVPVFCWEFLAHIICFFIIFNARIYDVGTSRRDYIALTGCILWSPLWLWTFSRQMLDLDQSYRYTQRTLAHMYIEQWQLSVSIHAIRWSAVNLSLA
ncbi:5109_t:CDS:2 [Cetraspora pellucida]|uniref:5109_t:CDS:1 n=1 Tax=Cetraspora pellucida TaxID=1433469 RepID=A0A9N9I586_9GLOM|nr:5109_t:CDS:2 [Cetraspora pellucida]